ncbi:MAG: methyltransferase domain-containing protein, partial [Acidobacteria bacterium]|nr:methyltransferase domain-containing protein [Acidobacteriota bacterium]
MAQDKKNRLCPVEKAGILDFGLRRLLQDPGKILRPYIREGMTVLDLGCGPGFFTLEMARLAGGTGKVIAADLQEGMLARLRAKIQNTAAANLVRFHRCLPDRIGLAEMCDFILVFYMLHEVPDQDRFLAEIRSLLKPGGKVLLAEPTWHVSRGEFRDAIARMEQAGFMVLERPAIRFSRAVLL